MNGKTPDSRLQRSRFRLGANPFGPVGEFCIPGCQAFSGAASCSRPISRAARAIACRLACTSSAIAIRAAVFGPLLHFVLLPYPS